LGSKDRSFVKKIAQELFLQINIEVEGNLINSVHFFFFFLENKIK